MIDPDGDVTFTHYAWLLCCPLYLAHAEDDSIIVVERHPALLPLWYFSVALLSVFYLPMAILRGGIQSPLPFLITGTIDGVTDA